MNHNNSVQGGISGSDTLPNNRLINKGYGFAFALVTSLFFLWAIANNFNDILIKQFQKALELSRMESGFIQTAFYLGYFLMALPAGVLMQKIGYQKGIVIGLTLYACGAFMFYPSADIRSFEFFLLSLFIIASGLTFLETAANPLITTLGPKSSAAQRLNLAQSFNGLGSWLAPLIGGLLIFSGVEHSTADLADMTPAALEAYRQSEANAVKLPYVTLGALVTLIAVSFYLVKFPAKTLQQSEPEAISTAAIKTLFGNKVLAGAIIAQFFYVGAQVSIWSYFINYSQDVASVSEKTAAAYLGVSMMAFMVGRFIGTWAMNYVQAEILLKHYSLIGSILCMAALFTEGLPSIALLGTTSFFMSIMFPTIFAFGIGSVNKFKKLASSLIIMAIIGGAIFPPIFGAIADIFVDIRYALTVPALCFIVIFFFATRYGHYHSE